MTGQVGDDQPAQGRQVVAALLDDHGRQAGPPSSPAGLR